MKRLYLVILGLLILSMSGYSQLIDFKNDNYWINAGTGNYYSTENTFGFTNYLGVNLFVDSTFYKVRLMHYQEFNLLGAYPSEEFNSVGVLIGKGLSSKYIQVQFSIGLGIIGGVKRGDFLYNKSSSNQGWISLMSQSYYSKDGFLTPSIPVEIDLLLKPIKYTGFGLSLFGNLNLIRPMYGLVFKVGLGKLR